jgi:spore maturation protein CgeB
LGRDEAMKILLVCVKHTYGDSARGYSYEYHNFYETLVGMGHEVELFDIVGELQAAGGREAMNAKLLSRCQEMKPAFSFFSLYTDQILPATMDAMRAFTKTFCFFHDDTWRVEFSRNWARHFDFFSTPDFYGIQKYKSVGLDQKAVFLPFGANPFSYQKLPTAEFEYDVSFVGAWHPYREWLIGRLKKAGVRAEGFGFRWPNGEVSQDEMVRIFNRSRINLNLSNSASWDLRYLYSSPRALLNRLRSPKTGEQLKGRHFEIAMCGGFQLSFYIDGLEHCYEIGQEVGIYIDSDDLISKTKFYLENENLRAQIALKGYERASANHSYVARFEELFKKIGVAT